MKDSRKVFGLSIVMLGWLFAIFYYSTRVNPSMMTGFAISKPITLTTYVYCGFDQDTGVPYDVKELGQITGRKFELAKLCNESCKKYGFDGGKIDKLFFSDIDGTACICNNNKNIDLCR